MTRSKATLLDKTAQRTLAPVTPPPAYYTGARTHPVIVTAITSPVIDQGTPQGFRPAPT